jgi:hypothetical protein
MFFIATDFNSLPDKPADKIIIHKPEKADIEQLSRLIPENLYLEINEGVLARGPRGADSPLILFAKLRRS